MINVAMLGYGGMAQVTLGYDFPCLSIGDWTMNGSRFSHRYHVSFEQANVEMEGATITVYPNDTSIEPYHPDVPHVGGIEGEIDYYLNLLENGGENLKNPPESAAGTACWRSADLGGARVKFANT